MLQDRADLRSGRRFALAQDHRHRLAAARLINVDRQKAALVIMGIEQGELLVAMHDIDRIVDVERDRGRRAPIAIAELIHQRCRHSGDRDLRRCILQPRHGRLRAQRLAALGQTSHRHLEDRIMPQ